jgi:phage shock protein A
LREITALPTRRDFTITVAASTLRPVNRLAFSSDAPAVSPAELQVGADRRKLGIGFSYLYLDEDTRALSRRFLANHSTFEGQIAALQGANAQLEARVAALQGANAQLEARVATVQGANTQLEERVAQLEGRMAIMENEVLQLRSSISLKVGRAVTFLPRAVFRLLKSCRSLGRHPS